MLMLPALFPEVSLSKVVLGPLSYLIIVSGLLLLAIRHRNRVERDRRAKLVESEERYRTLFERAREAIIVSDLDDRIIFANPAAATMLGRQSPQEMIGTLVTNIYADSTQREAILAELTAQGYAEHFEATLVKQDGSGASVHTVGSAVLHRDKRGEGQRTEIILTDITERRRAEQLLRALNQAALAIETTLTPKEIFTAVARELKQLGFSCAVFLTDESLTRLFPRYLSYEVRALEAVEKLAGLKAGGFSIPIETIDMYRKGVWERQTVFIENAIGPTRQILPGPLKRLAGQMVKMLQVPKSINSPLIVEDKVIGLLSVQSNDLTADDVSAITAFAHQMAAAWHRARLFDQAQQEIDERKVAEAALLRSLEETGRRQRLLLALSHAAQAVQRARTPTEIYRTVGEEIAALGYHAVVFTLTADQAHMVTSYVSFESALLRAAEKLAGLSAQDFQRAVVPGSHHAQAITEGRTVFFEAGESATQGLPKRVRPLLGQLYAMLGIEQVIYAPLRVDGEICDLLTVCGTGLTEADVPAVTTFANQAAIAIENARLFEQVRTGHEQLQTLSRRLVETQEIERRHLVRELHDEIGQALTGLKLALEMSARLSADAVRDNLDKAQALINELIVRVRDLSLDLRPAMLDDLGLLPALLWHLERYTAQTNVRVTFKHAGLTDRRYPPEVETAAYRVVQEALTNVARHAGVSEATVRLWADQEMLNVQVEDRGAGFDAEAALAAGTTRGLIGMRERVGLLGGQLTVEPVPGEGTCLTAELPLSEPVGKGE
jgi:PAS domain S-box-containing protein